MEDSKTLLKNYLNSVINNFTKDTIETLKIFAKQKAENIDSSIESEEIQIRLKLKRTKTNEILRLLNSMNFITFSLNGKSRMYYITDYGKMILSMLFKK